MGWLWAILENWLPLLLATLFGLLLGFLAWGWRRRVVSADQWNTLSASAQSSQAELASVRAAHDELATERSALNARVSSLSADLDGSNAARVKLSGDYDKVNAAQAKFHADLDASNKRIALLQADLDGANARAAALDADLGASKTQIAGFVNLEGDSKKLRSDLTAASGRVGDLEASLASANGRIGELEAELAVPADTSDLDAANARIGELEASLGSARTEVDGAHVRIADYEAQLEASRVRSGELENELGGAHSQIAGFASLEADSSQVKVDLDAAGSRIGELEGELGGARGRIGELEAQLAIPADTSDLDAANARIGELEGQLGRIGELEGELGGAHGRIGELEGQLGRIGELEGELGGAHGRIGELEGQLGRIGELEGELGGAHGRIGELEGQLADKDGQLAGFVSLYGVDDGPDEASQARLAGWQSGAWQAGTTSLGTVGSDHADDLKAISGIGPKMEGILNGFGIQSWEQLAAMSEQDVATVDDALVSFKGRITRDEWVEQAQAIMDNGHRPIKRDKAAEKAIVRLGDAEDRIAELEGELAGAADASELDGARDRIGELESDLGGAHGRIGELEGQLEGAGSAAEMGQLRVDLSERDRRIAALEAAGRTSADAEAAAEAAKAKLVEANARIKELEAQAAAQEASLTDAERRMVSWRSGGWEQGKTKLGTAGADHSDDLKVISGIGPQMEELLQGFGITSWEQLAAMSDADITTVDAALEDFPGRITRDEWVPQAKAIMENGHEPVQRAPKKRAKPAWQKGTTKLGTAGAGHTDDLKVINGIGPKMEGILNSFGITAWEQLAVLKKAEVTMVNEALEFFPGRIERDQWVPQAKELVKEFPDPKKRPTRETYLNRSSDDDPWN